MCSSQRLSQWSAAALLGWVCLAAMSASAQRIERYQFVPTDDLGFIYNAGLSGFRMNASLEGHFSVTYPDIGEPFISQFDVTIAQFVTEGPDFGMATGRPLDDFLYHDPVGLPFGRIFADLPGGECHDGLCTRIPDDLTWREIAQTVIWVDPGQGGVGAMQLRSNGRGFILDGLSATTVAGGLPVRLVPEPNAIRIASVLLLVSAPVVSARRRHHFQTKSP